MPEYKVRKAFDGSSAAPSSKSNKEESSIICMPTKSNSADGTFVSPSDQSPAIPYDSNVSGFDNVQTVIEDSNNSNEAVQGDEVEVEDVETPTGYTIYHATNHCPASSQYLVFKARVVRTADNPTLTQVERSETLKQRWEPSVRDFIDGGIQTGTHCFITHDQMISEDYTCIPNVPVFATKRNSDRKFRLTPDGSKEAVLDFEPGSLASSGVDSAVVNFVLGFCAHNDLEITTSDVKQAYPYHNRWDDPDCRNPRRVCTVLSAFLSGTGNESTWPF